MPQSELAIRANSDLARLLEWCAAQSSVSPWADVEHRAVGATDRDADWVRSQSYRVCQSILSAISKRQHGPRCRGSELCSRSGARLCHCTMA